MDIQDNQQFNSEQEQPQRDQVDSVTQNQHDASPDANGSEGSSHTEGNREQEGAQNPSLEEQKKQESQEEQDQQDHQPEELVEQPSQQEESSQPEEERSETGGESQAPKNLESQEDSSIPGIDYTTFSREDLIERLKNLLQSNNINDIKKEVDIIKATFYKKQRALNEEKKKEFINKGGQPEDFSPGKDPLEQELKDLLKNFKEKKAEENSDIEEEKKKNLRKKYEVIEELKNLVNKKESLGQTFREFRELQKRWKEIGPVPQNKLKDLWGTYHHHVERFYDYVKINKELRDLDLKKNLEAKLDLCEKAEKLDELDDIVAAFNTLQEYHDQWREIGPVPNDKKEELWQRFKEATRVINKKHQEHFKELRKQQNENLEAKQKICEQAEEIAEMEIDTHKDWNHYTRQILDLQKEWRKIGFAPKKHNNKIYRRFRKACDRFFAKKRVFYTQHKEWQENNLKKKQEFAERAEELKESTDWDNTAKELIELQKKWKEIGPVPKRHSEEIWNRFRSACDEFFQKKKSQDSSQSKDYSQNLKQKQDLIEQIRNFQPGADPQENLKRLMEFDEQWSNIGFVPYKYKDKIQQEYREAMYEQYDKLKIDDNQRELYKYRSKIKNIQQKPKAENRLRQERDKFMNKIKKLETNIITWENNLGFISGDSSEASSMIQDFEDKIQRAKKEMDLLEEKIRLIDQMDTEE
ncbi:MAG: DUF349 domain-containing protein [Bacteroidales bacterium]|nr:DUF349 domain-containing protein [Bacteroidales bacterium]